MLTTWLAGGEVLKFPGVEGKPGNGLKVVLVSGDEEYRSEEALPMLGKILSQHHGFECVVLFSWSEDGTHITPNNPAGIKGWEELADADLMVISTRFRNPSADDAKWVTEFLNEGRPIIALRTATHAFNGEGDFGGVPYGEFGLKFVGEKWVAHHGEHKVEGARAVIEKENASHPVLNSVEDIFGPSDVYTVENLKEEATILLRGAVTETLAPDSKILEGAKNDPMQALAWVMPYDSPDGKKKGQTFTTTMGASVDLLSEDLRRLIVNAAYFLSDLDVPEQAEVSYVDPYDPAFYTFIKDDEFWREQNLQPQDFALGKSKKLRVPEGTLKWERP